MDLRAVRDGLIGGCFARALIVMPSLNCGTSVNTMSVVAKARMLKERLSEFLKPRAYSAIGLDFLDKPVKPVVGFVNVNRTLISVFICGCFLYLRAGTGAPPLHFYIFLHVVNC